MRNATAALLIVILIPVTLVFLLVSSVKFNVINPGFIKGELASQNIYEKARQKTAWALVNSEFFADMKSFISAPEMEKLVFDVFPAAWLKKSVEGVVDGAFGYFNGPKDAVLSLPVDMREPKANLVSGFDSFLTAKVKNLPACPKYQRPTKLCSAPGVDKDFLKKNFQTGGLDVDGLVKQVPDTLDLADPASLGFDYGTETSSTEMTMEDQVATVMSSLRQAKDAYQLSLVYFWYFAYGYAFLILIYLLISLTGVRGFVRRTGVLLLSLGILPLALSLADRFLASDIVSSQITILNLPEEAGAMAIAVAGDIREALFSPLLYIGAGSSVLGLLLIIGGAFIPKPGKKEERPLNQTIILNGQEKKI